VDHPFLEHTSLQIGISEVSCAPLVASAARARPVREKSDHSFLPMQKREQAIAACVCDLRGIVLARLLARRVYPMSGKKTLMKLVQDEIDKGATTVEEIHKAIADLPLRVLEESDLLKGPAKEVRRVQDHTIGAIYDVIRDVNQKIGTFASELLAEAAKSRSTREEAARKHSAHRAAAH
jgi:hypothetical protein